MKIRVSFTLDIDPEAIEDNYGVDRSEVRAFVQEMAESDLLQQYASLGILAGGPR